LLQQCSSYSGLSRATSIPLAERILGSVNKVLTGDEDSVQAADMFGRDASLFGRVLNAMLKVNAAMDVSMVTDKEAQIV
jgi:twitching motility protein PilJ